MIKKYILKTSLLTFLFSLCFNIAYSDNHNVLQILEALQQDIKTLERAVYSDSFENKNLKDNTENFPEGSSEEALTRHLLILANTSQ